MRRLKISAAMVAAILGSIMTMSSMNGCVVVDDPQHCANREGAKTCAELYAPGVYCSVCERFYNGCVDEEPEPECRLDQSEESDDTDDSASSEEGSSSDAAALECETCADDDAGGLEAVR